MGKRNGNITIECIQNQSEMRKSSETGWRLCMYNMLGMNLMSLNCIRKSVHVIYIYIINILP
jgi:hypothetical protein